MRAPADRSSATELLPSVVGVCGASFSDTVHLARGEAAALASCNLPADFTIPDISTTYAPQCKSHRGAVRSAPRDFGTNGVCTAQHDSHRAAAMRAGACLPLRGGISTLPRG